MGARNFCPGCGIAIVPNVRHCMNCGEFLGEPPLQPVVRPFEAMSPREARRFEVNDSIETMVKVYKDPKDFQKESQKLSKDGWSVKDSVDHQPRAGFVRTMSGLGLLGSRPKAEMVITYVRWSDKKKRKNSLPPGM